jgi:hypothetical protein
LLLCAACSAPSAALSPSAGATSSGAASVSAPEPTAEPTPTPEPAIVVVPSPAPTPPADGSLTVTIRNNGLVLPGAEVDTDWKTSIHIAVGYLWFVNDAQTDHSIIQGRGGTRDPHGFKVELDAGKWAAVEFRQAGSYRLSDERQPLVELQVTVE